jgi:hypothetical protein
MSENFSGISTNNSNKKLKILNKSYFQLINIISSTIEMMIEENKKLPNYRFILHSQAELIFAGKSLPNFSLFDYIKRIANYTEINQSTLIISLIYIDKFCELTNLILTPYNIHRIICSSILCAIKFNEDKNFKIKYYAEIFGICSKELRKLELKFTEMSGFKFYVNQKLFIRYKNYLLKLKGRN